MRRLHFSYLIVATMLLALTVASASNASTVKKKHKKSKNLSTDISFTDATLHGHYQTPDEASARVENEKVLDDLLTVRTNFKDRLKQSSEQN